MLQGLAAKLSVAERANTRRLLCVRSHGKVEGVASSILMEPDMSIRKMVWTGCEEACEEVARG